MISPSDGNIYLYFSFSFLGPRDVDEGFSTHTLFSNVAATNLICPNLLIDIYPLICQIL